MGWTFTAKAELDGVGTTGAPATPSDDGQLAYWRAHSYVVETEALKTMSASIRKPPLKSAMEPKETA